MKQQGLLEKIKKSNYIKALKDGFWRIWENKQIWFWGLFLFMGSFSLSNNGKEDYSKVSFSEMIIFWNRYWKFIIAGFIVGLILFLIFWVISSIARAGLIAELNKKQNNKKTLLGFKKVWTVGKKDFKKVLGLDLFVFKMFFLVLMAVLIIFLPAILFKNLTTLVISSILSTLVVVIASSLLVIIKPFALMYLLLSDQNPKEAYLKSFKVLKSKYKEFFKLLLTLLLVSIVISIVIILTGMIGAISVGLIILLEGFVKGLVFVMLMTVLFLFALIVSAFASLWKLDLYIWWVKYVDGIKVSKSKKTVNKKNIKLNKAEARAGI